MKIFTKRNNIFFIIVGLVLLNLLINTETFVPQNRITDFLKSELIKSDEITSCQIDCTLNDGLFHEECVGFNGCEDSPFLRNRTYCEKDSDCVVDFGCCSKSCEHNCFEKDFCPVSNNYYVEAHVFSCDNNIICETEVLCSDDYKKSCFNNFCRIIS